MPPVDLRVIRRRFLWALGAGLGTALITGAVVRSGFLGVIGAFIVFVWVLPVLSVLTLAVYWFDPIRRSWPMRPLAPWLLPLTVSLGVSAIVAAITAGVCERWDTAQALGYCDRLIVRLEQARRVDGQYPDERAFDVLIADHAPPLLLRGDNLRYDTDGTTYELNFFGRGMVGPAYSYDSPSGAWIVD